MIPEYYTISQLGLSKESTKEIFQPLFKLPEVFQKVIENFSLEMYTEMFDIDFHTLVTRIESHGVFISNLKKIEQVNKLKMKNINRIFSDSIIGENLKEITLDVRDMVKKGIDPFQKIMESLDNLLSFEYLTLLHFFYPIPLLRKLASQYVFIKKKEVAFSVSIINIKYEKFLINESQKNGNRDIRISKGYVDCSKERILEKIVNEKWSVKELNVLDYPMPEPLSIILDQLALLKPKEVLKVIHRRRPDLLAGMAEQRGYRVSIFDQAGEFLFFIYPETFLTDL